MKNLNFVSVSIAVLFFGVAGASEKHASIPTEYIGEWNSDLRKCGTWDDDSRLEIKKDSLEFYESAGAVKSVTVKSDFEVVIVTTLSGEGETWSSTDNFHLSNDLKTLTHGKNDSKLVRYRCPK